MPKTKNYEFDYEWNGNSQPQKGVNIKAKNPFAKPLFASVKQSKPPSYSAISSTPVQAPTDIDELRKSHPWQKPQWATVDKSPKKHRDVIDKDSIPKPMLKKTPGAAADSTNVIKADDDAIAAMERKLAAAKQRKAELQAKQQTATNNVEDEAARTKHTVEESKLERARRIAKEKELERWRATLKERNEQTKTKRTALVSNVRDDTAWQRKSTTEQEDEVVVVAREEPIVKDNDVGNREDAVTAHETVKSDASSRNNPSDTTGNELNSSSVDTTADELARQIAQLELELQQYQ